MPGRVENMKRACDVYEQTVEEAGRQTRAT